MDEWNLEPARDIELAGMDRYSSYRRETGLVESTLRLIWWVMLRTVFRVWNRLSVIGRQHLPQQAPYILVANHVSHLDALLLTTALPFSLRDRTFPIAAHDVFFQRLSKAAFAANFINALPISRQRRGRHELDELRARLVDESSVFILFPEGTRTRTGEMNPFKAGIGMLAAGSPVPVVPCYLAGAEKALPPHARLLRPKRITIYLGAALTFDDLPFNREGWQECAARLERAVRGLAESAGIAAPPPQKGGNG